MSKVRSGISFRAQRGYGTETKNISDRKPVAKRACIGVRLVPKHECDTVQQSAKSRPLYTFIERDSPRRIMNDSNVSSFAIPEYSWVHAETHSFRAQNRTLDLRSLRELVFAHDLVTAWIPHAGRCRRETHLTASRLCQPEVPGPASA
jgi:hypothetical protein